MINFSKEYIDKFSDVIALQDVEEAKKMIADLHPADIAELYGRLNLDERRFIYLLLDDEKAADVFTELDEDLQKELMDVLPVDVVAKRFFDHMDTDDAVDLIRELDEKNRKKFFPILMT